MNNNDNTYYYSFKYLLVSGYLKPHAVDQICKEVRHIQPMTSKVQPVADY